jgi:heptosyltransferase-2
MKILLIQTAFIGDVILVTPLIEKLHRYYPAAQLDVMLRRGNEGLLAGNPHVSKLWIWDKKQGKYKSLFALLKKVRREKYDLLVNLQRFASTGIFTALAGAKSTVGFDKNPLSFLFGKRVKHLIGSGTHEVQRNLQLIAHLTDSEPEMPKLYPQPADYETVEKYNTAPYITISPTSVWFTKQFPIAKWNELISLINSNLKIFLLGGKADREACEQLVQTTNGRAVNLAGELTFLQSAALMRNAAMNYVNDSAPMHIASAMNAPTTAVFCSTVPAFGFGPLAKNSRVVEVDEKLDCRPCGLHGRKACPKKHFRCAYDIDVKKMLL